MYCTNFNSFNEVLFYFKKISFHIESENLDTNIIGSRKSIDTLSQVHEPSLYERFTKLSKESFQVCPLRNDRLLFLMTDGSIRTHDKHLNLIQCVTQVDNKTFHFDSVTTNSIDRIYFIGCRTSHITMTDFNFNLIRRVNLMSPNDITFYNNHLYVCDGSPMVSYIVKLTADLALVSRFKMDTIPNQIKILNNIACILTTNSTIYFYDISKSDDFRLLYKYKDFGKFRCLYSIHSFSTFYLSTYDSNSQGKQIFYFFKNNGESYKRMEVEQPIYGKLSSFFEFDGKLFNNFYNSSESEASSELDFMDLMD
jgi:hypothetical protein